MYAGQKISTAPAEPRPIQGQLTVVIRDPDQPGAPELRRYKVSTPPQGYMGKTISITNEYGNYFYKADDLDLEDLTQDFEAMDLSSKIGGVTQAK